MAYAKIQGQVPNYIDENGNVVDQYYVRVKPFVEDGSKKVILNGKKKSVKELMEKFQPKEEYTEEVSTEETTGANDGATVVTETQPEEEEEKKSQSKEEMIISLFEGNDELTYKEVTDIMERQGLKVTSNDIADAKKVWKGEK